MSKPPRIFRWQDYIESILLALLLALVIRSFVISGYRVPTQTMAPTLLPGDFIFSWKLPYGIKVPFSDRKLFVGPPERGQVVVFTFVDQPKVNYVKRVIGVSGDLVEIKSGEIFLNSKKWDSEKVETLDANQEIWSETNSNGQYLILRSRSGQNSKDFGPLVVPEGEVFVLGDNRELSDDSRYWGTVPISRIEGRVLLVRLSLKWTDSLSGPSINWQRTWTLIK